MVCRKTVSNGEYDYATTIFHPYIDFKDTNTSFGSIEEALCHSIAILFDGVNSYAGHYFCKMIGMYDER